MQFQKDSTPSRIKDFKNRGKDSEEMRRRRNNVSIELRKSKKDEQLLKKRNMTMTGKEPTIPLQDYNARILLSVDEIIQGIQSSDENMLYLATKSARTLLSRENKISMDFIINGIVPRCIEFLSYSHNPALQLEAAWALTFVVSGTSEQTMAVINGGAISKLVNLLGSKHPHVAEQAVWALGNIAGDGAAARDLVLEHNAMPALLELIKPDISVHFQRIIVWSLSIFCRNKYPPPPFDNIKMCLPYLSKLLYHSDNDVISDTCWALSYLTDGPNYLIQAVIDIGVVPRLVELISTNEVGVLIPALRTVGNIVTENDTQTDVIIEAGGLPRLATLLQHTKRPIVREAAWIVSNITAGNPEQIQHVINVGVLPPLINIMLKGDYRAQNEAVWAVTNLISNGTSEQLATLVDAGAIPAMCQLLSQKDCTSTICVILDGFHNLLLVASKSAQAGIIANMIEEHGGLDKIQALQNNDFGEIHQKCITLIEKFFQICEEEELYS